VGANVDCRPKYLEQFALMGTIYSQYVMGVEQPKVGLLNIGEESSKGNDLALATYQLLENNKTIPFIGNAEGRDILSGQFDVIVCDGFVGISSSNLLKLLGKLSYKLCVKNYPKGHEVY
jgi:glycerol-3-phosphate acyltransferase PlsX